MELSTEDGFIICRMAAYRIGAGGHRKGRRSLLAGESGSLRGAARGGQLGDETSKTAPDPLFFRGVPPPFGPIGE